MIDVSTLLVHCVDTFSVYVDAASFLPQPVKFNNWELCRHIFEVSQPAWNFTADCVDTHNMCVGLFLSYSSNYVDTW